MAIQPIFMVLLEEAKQTIYRLRQSTRAALLSTEAADRIGPGSKVKGNGKEGSNVDADDNGQSDVDGGAVGMGRGGILPSHRKRCQELIGSPRRFMNMEDGFVFPAEHLLANPRGSDFSITFWLYLTQDSTGKYRTILTRGQRSERWPVVMLRDVDRRIEIGFGLPSMATLCERLTSKDPLPLNKWVHVCMVSEGNKLRLYINGVLDYQRSNMGLPKECRHP